MQSRDHFYLPASAQNSDDSEELLKAKESDLSEAEEKSFFEFQKMKIEQNLGSSSSRTHLLA